MASTIEHKDEEGHLIYKIDKKTKKGKYHPIRADKQKEFLIDPVILDGYDKLPSGFYKDGFGLTRPGDLVLREISKRQGNKKIKLTVVNKPTSKLNLRGKTIQLTLSGVALADFGATVRGIKSRRNAEMVAEAQNFLGTQFAQYKSLRGSKVGYVPGSLADIFKIDKVAANISNDDRQALESFIPEYLKSIPGTLKAKKKLKVIFDTLDAGKKIYLGKILKEFRSKLQKQAANENVWQRFLSEYILLLQHNYGEVLEKKSVSLQGKFPDFMLVDPYGYLDIYEIKKPATNLMRLDPSRNNYYWDTELSKAIAQVENYMYQIQRNADTLMTDIRKSHGIDVNVVRPRGFIVVGLRSQLISSKMKDDFRILCSSLKNVDIILYDDLLASLEAFADRAISN